MLNNSHLKTKVDINLRLLSANIRLTDSLINKVSLRCPFFMIFSVNCPNFMFHGTDTVTLREVSFTALISTDPLAVLGVAPLAPVHHPEGALAQLPVHDQVLPAWTHYMNISQSQRRVFFANLRF